MESYDFYEYINEDSTYFAKPTGMQKFNQPPLLTPKAKEQARINDLQNMIAKYRQPLSGMASTPIQLAAWGQKEASPEEQEEMIHDFDALSSSGMQVPDALKKSVYRNARRKSRISLPPVPNPNLPSWMNNRTH